MPLITTIASVSVNGFAAPRFNEIDITPVMTSNITPSGVVSAKSIYSAGYPAWYALDNNGGSFWASGAGDPYSWWQYQFPKAVRLSRVDILSTPAVGGTQGTPKEFQVLGSNNGIDWTTLGEFDTPAWPASVWREFKLSKMGLFSYYRINVSMTQVPAYVDTGFAQVRFIERRTVWK